MPEAELRVFSTVICIHLKFSSEPDRAWQQQRRDGEHACASRPRNKCRSSVSAAQIRPFGECEPRAENARLRGVIFTNPFISISMLIQFVFEFLNLLFQRRLRDVAFPLPRDCVCHSHDVSEQYFHSNTYVITKELSISTMAYLFY